MTRPLFRLWDKINKKILYYDKDIVTNMTINGVLIDDKGSNVSNKYEIMQSTGVKDKNGKLLYEGDILKIVDWENTNFTKPMAWEKGRVRHDDGGFMVHAYELRQVAHHCKVIGNVYENLDVLKDQIEEKENKRKEKKLEIKNRFTGDLIYSSSKTTLKEAVEEAVSEGANLEYTNLEYTNLENANLECANLEGANLEDANLEHANLKGANLEDANLEYANLEDANLKGANLEYANLECANLEHANLEHANLEHANLEHANLKGANLKGANLKGATTHNCTINFHSSEYEQAKQFIEGLK